MELALITLLMVKHVIADYFMQYSWMMKDKGTYGAKGGIAHSSWHGTLTFIVLELFSIGWPISLALAIVDAVLHYHIDYVKSNVWKTRGYTPANQMYWVTHGVDQLLHLLTYVAIVALCV
jgi:hypothetical protein